ISACTQQLARMKTQKIETWTICVNVQLESTRRDVHHLTSVLISRLATFSGTDPQNRGSEGYGGRDAEEPSEDITRQATVPFRDGNPANLREICDTMNSWYELLRAREDNVATACLLSPPHLQRFVEALETDSSKRPSARLRSEPVRFTTKFIEFQDNLS